MSVIDSNICENSGMAMNAAAAASHCCHLLPDTCVLYLFVTLRPPLHSQTLIGQKRLLLSYLDQ